jgi:hypothetical protein
MDACLADFEMLECEKGHVFCEEHKLGKCDEQKEPSLEEMKSFLLKTEDYAKEDLEEMEDYEIEDSFYEYSDDDGVSSLNCPICQLKNIEKNVLLKFVLSKLGLTQEQAEDEIRKEFKTYEEIEKAFKNK